MSFYNSKEQASTVKASSSKECLNNNNSKLAKASITAAIAARGGGSLPIGGEKENYKNNHMSSSIINSNDARKKWRDYGESASQALEERRRALLCQNNHLSNGSHENIAPFSSSFPQQNNNSSSSCSPLLNGPFSVRIISAEDRIDLAGSSYTAYIIELQNPQHTPTRNIVEHRYSEFARLNKELLANSIHFRSSFPNKSLVGRLGNWTPSSRIAPTKMHELITYRKIKLDIWLVELCEKLSRDGEIVGGLRDACVEFLRHSGASVPPCDRANPVPDQDSTQNYHCTHPYPNQYNEVTARHTQTKHASINAERYISNPLSFTLGGEIRKATYIVRRMCGSNVVQDQSIPLDLLHKAWGLCFLTVVKAGFVVSGRFGTGLILARAPDGGWSPPTAVGTLGMGWGALFGGDITTYLIVFNTKRAVMAFAQNNGSVNLGAEVGVAVGPVGRGATGNLNAGFEGGVAPAYAYAHSKGFFVGISLEGSVVVSRPDVNAKFYGRQIHPHTLLFSTEVPRPRAAQPLYKALRDAMNQPITGFRPSMMSQNFSGTQNAIDSCTGFHPSNTNHFTGTGAEAAPGYMYLQSNAAGLRPNFSIAQNGSEIAPTTGTQSLHHPQIY